MSPDLPDVTRTFRDVPRDFNKEQANADFLSDYCGIEDYTRNFYNKIKIQVNSYVIVTSLKG